MTNASRGPGRDDPVVSVPVLIVGGGPVGLALANELGWRGIDYLLVEQGDGSIAFPAGEGIFSRTMEHLRRWGAADAVRHTPHFPDQRPRNIVFSTRLIGQRLALFDGPPNAAPDPMTPEPVVVCPKIAFDPALRANAQRMEVGTLRYHTRLLSFEQTPAAVVAQLEHVSSGQRTRVEARYLAACDGAHSPIRKALGIEMLGDFATGENFAVHFRALTLDRLLIEHYGVPITQLQTLTERRAYLTAVDGATEWRLSMYVNAGEQFDADDVLREFLGPQIPFTVLKAQNWNGHRVVAERFRDGNVFLVGDANHLRWPKGGFGANKGIGDAVDLGWKLGAVLRGWGGAALLDTYDTERRPIAQRYVNEAATNRTFDAMISPDPLLDRQTDEAAARDRVRTAIFAYRLREYRTAGIQLGYRYRGSPLCIPDPSSLEPPDDHMLYVPSTWPGCRAPHGWLEPGRSTLDLFGDGFVLMRGDPAIDIGALERAFTAAGVPLRCHDLHSPELRTLYERALVLVRPDGHVAWRGEQVPPDATRMVAVVSGQMSHGASR